VVSVKVKPIPTPRDLPILLLNICPIKIKVYLPIKKIFKYSSKIII